jgi:hypothetical protein
MPERKQLGLRKAGANVAEVVPGINEDLPKCLSNQWSRHGFIDCNLLGQPLIYCLHLGEMQAAGAKEDQEEADVALQQA